MNNVMAFFAALAEKDDGWFFATIAATLTTAQEKANAILSILLAFGMNDSINPDGTWGAEARKGIKAIEDMPECPRKQTIANLMIDLLFNLGLNNDLPKDGFDGTFGPNCRLAIQKLEEMLTEEAE